MRIISSIATHDTDFKAEFFKELEPFKNDRVFFRGRQESCHFHHGYLRDFGGDTVTFWNGEATVRNSQEWVYPFWEVMIAVED
jgi:hypothetical protein